MPTNVFSSILILFFNARLYIKRDNNVEGFVHAIKHRLFVVCEICCGHPLQAGYCMDCASIPSHCESSHDFLQLVVDHADLSSWSREVPNEPGRSRL